MIMKKVNHWSKRTLAPSLLLVGLAFASCQQDEVISTQEPTPVNEEKGELLTSDKDGEFILNEAGEVIGSFNRTLEPLDLAGKPMTMGRTEFDQSSPQRVAFWRGRNYKYGRNALYGGGSTVNWNFSTADNLTVSSLSIPPGCDVTLYDGVDQTGSWIKFSTSTNNTCSI